MLVLGGRSDGGHVVTSGFSLHTGELHSAGNMLGDLGTQLTKGGSTLQQVGQHLVDGTRSDESGVGKILASGLGRVSEIAGKVFSEGGRVSGAAGKRLHGNATSHEDNEESVTSRFRGINDPKDGPSSHAVGTSTAGKAGSSSASSSAAAKGKGRAIDSAGSRPKSTSSGGGVSGDAGGDDPKRPGGNPLGNSHTAPTKISKRKRGNDDEDANTPNKSARTSADPSPPRRATRQTAPMKGMTEQEVTALIGGRAGEPARPGGGGFVLSNGSGHSAVLTGADGQPVALTTHRPSASDSHSSSSSDGSADSSRPSGSESIGYNQMTVSHDGVNPQQRNPVAPNPNAQGPRNVGVGGHSGGMSSHYVSQDVVNSWTGRERSVGQGTVMGGSAKDAMHASGQGTHENSTVDWMHGLAHSSGGPDHVDPQTMENLPTAGEHGANMRHNVWEKAVQNEGTSMHGAVPHSAQPTDPINQQNHVFRNLNYTTHSPYEPGLAHTESINTLNPTMPRQADYGYAGRQQEANSAMQTMHMLGQNGEDLNSYHPGLHDTVAGYGDRNQPGDGSLSYGGLDDRGLGSRSPSPEPAPTPTPPTPTTPTGSQHSDPSIAGQLDGMNLDSQYGGAPQPSGSGQGAGDWPMDDEDTRR